MKCLLLFLLLLPLLASAQRTIDSRTNNATIYREGDKKIYVLTARPRYLETGETWKSVEDGGELQVDTARGRSKGKKSTKGIDIGPNIEKQITVEEYSGNKWKALPKPDISYRKDRTLPDDARFVWYFDYTKGRLEAIVDITPAGDKWAYALTATEAGQYRMIIDLKLTDATESQARENKQGQTIGAIWQIPSGVFRFNWQAELDQTDSSDIKKKQLTLITKPFDLAVDETYVFDPAIDAGDSWECETPSTCYKDDGDGNRVGTEAGVLHYCTTNRFDISAVDPTEVVTDVEFQWSVIQVDTDGDSYYIGPYAGDGYTQDPLLRTDAQKFTDCQAVLSTNYATTTQFNSLGIKTETLGGSVNADIENARDSGTVFSVGIHQTNDAGFVRGILEEATQANPPVLTVTTSPPTAAKHPWFYIQQAR